MLNLPINKQTIYELEDFLESYTDLIQKVTLNPTSSNEYFKLIENELDEIQYSGSLIQKILATYTVKKINQIKTVEEKIFFDPYELH